MKPPLARQPDYPIPCVQAVHRLTYLNDRAGKLVRLATTCHPSEVAEVQGELQGVLEEATGLADALAHVSDLKLAAVRARCRYCRKLPHRSQEDAERHRRTLSFIDDRRGREPIHVYRCPSDAGVWHVGHSRPKSVAA